MKNKAILITGGAGYIGSHVAIKLHEQGHTVVVVDNLSTGSLHAVQAFNGILYRIDISDSANLQAIFDSYDIDTVMHFAAKTKVGESVENPLLYYRVNTAGTRVLLEACVKNQVKNFVFSSTAAVYGIPDGLAREDSMLAPINPYGSSKLMSEWMLRDTATASNMKYVALRYFNVAGCDSRGRIGQSTPESTLLIKVAAEVAVGKRSHLTVFGNDYPTADGTCIRDYIHVEDLAEAHLSALDYLRDGGKSIALNVGYGMGYSVNEVIRAMEKAHGSSLPVTQGQRRQGDPPVLVANNQLIQSTLNWIPRRNDLELICRSTLSWEKYLMHGVR